MGRSKEVADKLEAYIAQAKQHGVTNLNEIELIVRELRSGTVSDDDPRVVASERIMNLFTAAVPTNGDTRSEEAVEGLIAEGKFLITKAVEAGDWGTVKSISQSLDRLQKIRQLTKLVRSMREELPKQEEWPSEVN